MTTVEVVRAGLLTTVQDLGRWGHGALGVPVAGPMDVYSHRLANLLVGNPASAATLEVTLSGPELLFRGRSTVVAVTGGVFEVTLDEQPVPLGVSRRVKSGQRLRFGRRRQGARAYVAVAGGFEADVVLGSRATHLAAGMGGIEGRALRAGDRLRVGRPHVVAPVERRGVNLAVGPERTILRVLPGPHDQWFAPEAMTVLCRETFRVSPRSNRMGFRLEGPTLPRAAAPELLSAAVPMGAIQVPPAGEAILLMADRQTTGGYPQVATVISADLPLAGQLAPGDAVGFRPCSLAEALAALAARERQLYHLTTAEAP